MYALAVFGITNDTVNTIASVAMLFLFVLYVALLFWTYADARRRIDDPMLIACATAASLFPFVGTLIYVIIRPPEFLDDVRLRELEMQAAEGRLAELNWHFCPHCDYEIKSDYLRCPNCQRRLKSPCATCAKPLDPAWKLCPYCEAEAGVAPPAPAPRPRRRRAPAGDQATVEAPAPRNR